MDISWSIPLVVCGALLAIVLVLLVPLPHGRKRASVPIARRRPSAVYRDDERYWSGGIFYHNPDDPDLFVPRRYGLGWTLNFGHPRSRFFLLLLFLVAILPPLVVALVNLLWPGSIHPTGCHPSGCF
ncbi:MAG TPA: DUF5808 domain-containing protein [Ktedonobacteraceae bacterium]|nr:DUF5808 domain-containing protein [Ktedonobacteraceae bacterium]